MNAHAVSLAVVAGKGDREKKIFNLSYGVFHGTAFCLAPHLFLTAGHVYRDAKLDGEVAVARLGPGQLQAEAVDDAEVFEAIDLAILRCPTLAAEVIPFPFPPLEYLPDVFSLGSPFGLNPPVWHMRA